MSSKHTSCLFVAIGYTSFPAIVERTAVASREAAFESGDTKKNNYSNDKILGHFWH